MIHFLIGLLILAVVIYCLKLVLDLLPIPEPIKTIAYIILGLIGFLWLLKLAGIAVPY